VNELERAADVVVDVLSAYVRASVEGAAPAITRRSVGDITERLELRAWLREGGMTLEDFRRFLEQYLDNSTRTHHPAYLAHQIAPPDVPAALADFVHGTINNCATAYELGPATAAVEVAVVEWLLEKLSWGVEGGGAITSGGSLGNLTGLLAARARVAPESWTDGIGERYAVLAPATAHYSVKRALAILGLGERSMVEVETDAVGRVVPERLPAALARARAEGRRPLAVVANACATATGLHDELRPIAAFCRAHDIWLHVDAAHGAPALLSERHRRLLDGIELADSVVWDGHKMMRTAAVCTAILFRRRENLEAAFHQEASYLLYDDAEGVDLAKRSIEATKGSHALKLFLNVAWRGQEGIGAYVDAQYETTRRFHELVSARPGFECPYAPDTNILCFRYGDDDALQLRIRERLIDEGDFHVSSAEVGGRRYLRVTIGSPATDERTAEALLDAIEAAAHALAPPEPERESRRVRAAPC
jgi:L-2,4-diaminobutyrate decarboxylase